MSLNIVDLYNKDYISKMGTEYICTGYMFDVVQQTQDLGSQISSFDLVGVTSGDSDYEGTTLEEDYNISPSEQTTDYSAGGQTGGMGEGSY
jgi:hypothetical protein